MAQEMDGEITLTLHEVISRRPDVQNLLRLAQTAQLALLRGYGQVLDETLTELTNATQALLADLPG